MSPLDYGIFALYMVGVLAVGWWFHRRNRSAEDFFVGGRSISSGHVGLSVAATDVGGGFSIGLGGLGYAIGLSGSWLLFTGLVGAWLSAVFVIPVIKRLDVRHGLMTYPDFLRLRYGGRVALVAAVISAVGYLGFTSGQILAGAKLMSGSLLDAAPFGLDTQTFAVLLIGVVIVGYTVMGGLKAVIYTDTVQWLVLMLGLVGLAIPFTLREVGGLSGLADALPPGHLSLTNVDALTFLNWFVTIAPIWVVAMTLYQRMYASPTVRDARRAWFIAGLFEYPVMAFSGAALGMMSRVLFPDIDGELGVPMLLTTVLPVGVAGVVVASYFSAVMSTADSCLIASSGNLVGDVLQRSRWRIRDERLLVRASQGATLLVGLVAVLIASRFTMVLDAILQAYAFLVAGLFVPTLGAYFWKRSSATGAFWAMIAGGGTTLVLLLGGVPSPAGLDPGFWGIVVSASVFVPLSLRSAPASEPSAAEHGTHPSDAATEPDTVERLGPALIQHGPLSDRIYVMKLAAADAPRVIPRVDALAADLGYGKIVAKCPGPAVTELVERGYHVEAEVPRFFGPDTSGAFVGKFLDPERAVEPRMERIREVLAAARTRPASEEGGAASPGGSTVAASAGGSEEVAVLTVAAEGEALALREGRPADAEAIASCYREVFESYPFPIHDPEHIREAMRVGTRFFTVWDGDDLVAASSMEDGGAPGTLEMTDFATLPDYRGLGLARRLLVRMERAAAFGGTRTAYTIARALSFGMNITFGRCGYTYAGTLINNTQIADSIESMNVWYRHLDR